MLSADFNGAFLLFVPFNPIAMPGRVNVGKHGGVFEVLLASCAKQLGHPAASFSIWRDPFLSCRINVVQLDVVQKSQLLDNGFSRKRKLVARNARVAHGCTMGTGNTSKINEDV